ncbi:hypothetical protein EOW65_16690 [Sinirhodobacter ferrireducens]|uniref:Uncharacterized protein n=1 Tax=Paenirhodobacter ferrireducens TaxID=1215032 RepID=A0A443L7L0_9RHOB|nr:hypothetical protein [Sinirhodobacter ferrireducens]RWR45215.1 hypothetical protein EOW65_16690 [Sinirhodobacter ferrireducens]
MVLPVSPLARLLDRLTPLDTVDRIDAIVGEINATGAGQLWVAWRPAQRVSAGVRIELHGIKATGRDIASACARWIAAAVDAAPLAEARARLALTG